jgi:predicted transcriptional regulator
MSPNIEKVGAQLIEALDDVNEQIERASEADATLQDIEGAKTLMAELVDRYEGLLKPLSLDEQRAIRQQFGQAVEQVKGKLLQLKEAPE